MTDEYSDNDRQLDEFGFPVEQKKPAQVDPLPVVVVPNPFSAAKDKPTDTITYTGKGDYKVRWKQDNREHYLKKNREYVAAYRERKRKSGKGY